MLRLLLVLCCIVYSSASSPCGFKCPCKNSSHLIEYYWVDFYGTIPRHAFPGGFDEEADETYIGQAYIKNYELLPGTIYKGCPQMKTSAYGQVLTPETNIKILCTKSDCVLNWKRTKAGELHQLTGCGFVVGGEEVDLTVYIGRTNYNGQSIIGKVFCDSASNAGLWIPESPSSVISEFDILTYGC